MFATGVRSTAIPVSIAAVVSMLAVDDSNVARHRLPSVPDAKVSIYGTADYARDHEYRVFRSQVVALGRR